MQATTVKDAPQIMVLRLETPTGVSRDVQVQRLADQ
jgi:hypothetical protein